MNPFNKGDWKKAAYKTIKEPDQAGPGWIIGGILLVFAVLAYILKSCGG
jgi:hypothetical protein